MPDDIAILMTTFNGEKYIEDQIKSIQNQTCTSWKLYIRDDGSSDATINLINMMSKEDSRISLVSDNLGNLGVKSGFMNLLYTVNAKIYFFSDQDDIWLPEKISSTIECFSRASNSIPILVHTNLTIVDENLKVLKQSFHSRNYADKLNILLVSNGVTGCTMAINESLKQKVKNDPATEMLMHDWWLGLCATSFGKTYFVANPLILYRQHTNNLVGTDLNLLDKIKRIKSSKSETRRLKLCLEQANNFQKFHESDLSHSSKNIINDFVSLPCSSITRRIKNVSKNHFRKYSVLGTLSFLKTIIFDV